jgi:hypothetical protein
MVVVVSGWGAEEKKRAVEAGAAEEVRKGCGAVLGASRSEKAIEARRRLEQGRRWR